MSDVIEIYDAEDDRIGKIVVDAAISVHRELGPGLLENVYEACLFEELSQRGLHTQTQVVVPIKFNEKLVKDGLKRFVKRKDSLAS